MSESGEVTAAPRLRKIKRLDLWFNKRREMRARRRGKTPVIVPSAGYGAPGWVRILGRTLLLKAKSRELFLHRPETTQQVFERGWRSFTSVYAPDEPINVIVNGQVVANAKTDDGGVLDEIVQVELPPGKHRLILETSNGDRAEATVFIIGDAIETGVISDIDDTILNTMLPRPFVAAWNSFVRAEQARLATPGMPVLFDHILHEANPDERSEMVPFFYLSTGAWNAAPALSRFLHRHLYPRGPLLLTDWGPTKDRIFRSGTEHKERELRRLVREFPNVRWFLFGDDGQHDEEIYRQFTEEFPEHIKAVGIRQLTTEEAVLAGGRSKARQHRAVSGVPWVYGPDGATLRMELEKLGLL